MKLLYGTGNPAKIEAMRKRTEGLGIELMGLQELDCDIPRVPEDGKTPLENARQKAMTYYRAFHIPVFSCDSGLYFDNVPEEVQPGVHVRTIQGKYLSDEEMLSYYSGLAKRYGNLEARKPHPVRKQGFPLDSLSLEPESGKYYYDLQEDKLDQVAVEDGFLDFFRKILEETTDKNFGKGDDQV